MGDLIIREIGRIFEKHGDASTAVCGEAICGEVICGGMNDVYEADMD